MREPVREARQAQGFPVSAFALLIGVCFKTLTYILHIKSDIREPPEALCEFTGCSSETAKKWGSGGCGGGAPKTCCVSMATEFAFHAREEAWEVVAQGMGQR